MGGIRDWTHNLLCLQERPQSHFLPTFKQNKSSFTFHLLSEGWGFQLTQPLVNEHPLDGEELGHFLRKSRAAACDLPGHFCLSGISMHVWTVTPIFAHCEWPSLSSLQAWGQEVLIVVQEIPCRVAKQNQPKGTRASETQYPFEELGKPLRCRIPGLGHCWIWKERFHQGKGRESSLNQQHSSHKVWGAIWGNYIKTNFTEGAGEIISGQGIYLVAVKLGSILYNLYVPLSPIRMTPEQRNRSKPCARLDMVPTPLIIITLNLQR